MLDLIKEVGYALVSAGKGLGVTLKNLFRRNVTLQYPEVKPMLSPRYRGRLDFNEDVCIACGLCVKACPSNVITLESGPPVPGKKGKSVQVYTMDFGRCVFCGLCVEACPTDALHMLQEYAYSGRSRDFLIYDKDRLKKQHVENFGETPKEEEPKPAEESSTEKKEPDSTQNSGLSTQD